MAFLRPLVAPPKVALKNYLAQRPAGAEEDVHMAEELADYVIQQWSKPGGVIFDPFAGFGTSLRRAVALGRRAGGVELLPERVALIEQLAPGAVVVAGDARVVLPVLDAQVDLVVASPPYMTATEHDADPLEAYERGGGDYQRYLAELGLVARECARLVAPGGFVVWNAGDILHAGVHTPLIADCTELLAQHLEQVAVLDVPWDEYPHDIIRDALLVFRRQA